MGQADFSLARRYYVDQNGRRVLVGLTIEETSEFERLDASSPELDGNGIFNGRSSEGHPTTKAWEQRWLELYLKHDEAWKTWIGINISNRCQEESQPRVGS